MLTPQSISKNFLIGFCGCSSRSNKSQDFQCSYSTQNVSISENGATQFSKSPLSMRRTRLSLITAEIKDANEFYTTLFHCILWWARRSIDGRISATENHPWIAAFWEYIRYSVWQVTNPVGNFLFRLSVCYQFYGWGPMEFTQTTGEHLKFARKQQSAYGQYRDIGEGVQKNSPPNM